MSKRGDLEFLIDMLEACNRIMEFTSEMTYEDFLRDRKTQDAVLRNIEILGEAVKRISVDLKEKYRDVEWKKVMGMRDRLIHFYFGVNLDIVWDVVRNKVPALRERLLKILAEPQ